MKTEIQELKKYRHQYENAQSDYKFEQAQEYLGKVYDKYGTIEIVEIQNLIN